VLNKSFWAVCDVCEDSTDASHRTPTEALEYAERGDWDVKKDPATKDFGRALCPSCRTWAAT
jgi:hypothetical protein